MALLWNTVLARTSLIALVGCLALQGCSGSSSLLSEGIGSAAYEEEKTERRIVNADRYMLKMCQRLNGCPDVSKKVAPAGFWKDITRTALNDIDERCDYYLLSLDEMRRDKLVWDRAWKDVGGSIKTIVAASSPGTKAIGILASAFDLSQHAGDEYYSAIIMSEEPSIIRRIVQKLQTEYRFGLNSILKDKDIDRSGAHYAIRGYLRLCMPLTIESELQSIKANVNYKAGSRVALERDAAVLKVLDGLPIIP